MATASEALIQCADLVKDQINLFTLQHFCMRGGRIGGGLGLVMESLWGFYASKHLRTMDVSLAWIPNHEFNDFACISDVNPWVPETKSGEVFRIEVKSMVINADESKAHFDSLISEIGEADLLVVITWGWAETDAIHVYPRIDEIGLFRSRSIARLRDLLHTERGGSFVDRFSCPDGCEPSRCAHHGEPVNASNVRERRSGPISLRGSNVSYAQNFGGLVRMVATRSLAAKEKRTKLASTDLEMKRYLEFVERLKTVRRGQA